MDGLILLVCLGIAGYPLILLALWTLAKQSRRGTPLERFPPEVIEDLLILYWIYKPRELLLEVPP